MQKTYKIIFVDYVIDMHILICLWFIAYIIAW